MILKKMLQFLTEGRFMELYWIWLSQLKYVGPVLQKKLLLYFQTPKAVYDANEDEISNVMKLNLRAKNSILNSRSLKDSERIMKNAERCGIHILKHNSDLYPIYAKCHKESPIVLYYKGNLPRLETAVGVVGARRCTAYGKNVAKEIGGELAKLQIPVISGFAKGIDSYAQSACVGNGGYTMAFLGCGPDVCYPSEQRHLYQQILEGKGVFISKYPPGTPPKPKYFIDRNAMISAWSTELVVVEAGEQSGALWTANFALKHDKPVYAVPNQIHIQEGAGTNRLLLNNSVKPYLGIQSLQATKGKMHSKYRHFTTDNNEDPILQHLSNSSLTVSQLSKQINLPETELMEKLIELELNKQIIIRGNIITKI